MTAITYLDEQDIKNKNLEILEVIPSAPQWVSAIQLRTLFNLNSNGLAYRISNLKKMDKIILRKEGRNAYYQKKDE